MAKRITKPKTVGALIDQHFELVAQQREVQRALDAIKEQIDANEQAVIEQLKTIGTDAARGSGSGGMATKSIKDVPQISDYDAFVAHVHKKKAFELLQRRLAVTAVRDRWEHGEDVPGVSHVTEVVVHWTAGRKKGVEG